MIEWRSLSDNMVIDTGPLLLPVTRQPGWDKVRELLDMHEKGGIILHIGLFNINEIISAMYRLGYDMKTSLEYATLLYKKLSIVRNLRYTTWMGILRAKARELGYAIPWGDLSTAAVALHMNIPALVLNEDKHFDQIPIICSKLNKSIQIIRVKDV